MKRVFNFLILGFLILGFTGCDIGQLFDDMNRKSQAKEKFNSFPKELQELNKKQYEAGYFTANKQLATNLYPMCKKHQLDISNKYYKNLDINCGYILNLIHFGREQ